MNVGQLKAALLLWLDNAAEVKIRAPGDPILDKILVNASVNTTTTGAGGEFVEQLNTMNLTLQVGAPWDTAMHAMLMGAKVVGSHIDPISGNTILEVDA